MAPAKDITSSESSKETAMAPNEFVAINEERQRLLEVNGQEPEYVNFNNAATKFLLDQVYKISPTVYWSHTYDSIRP